MTKQEMRDALRRKRAALSPTQKKELDEAVVKRIAASRLFQNASSLLLYAPLPQEINLLPLVRLAREMGKPVAFPRCDTATGTMRFYELLPDARLREGAYHIPEPPDDAPLHTPDADALCILPGLTFDPFGARLGYGKGYYDRFLTDFPGVTAGAVYTSFLVRRVPTEPHDIPVGYLFTERGTLSCQKQAASESRALVAVSDRDIPERHADRSPAENADGTGATDGTRQADKSAQATHEALRTRCRRMLSQALHAPPLLVLSTFLLLLLSRFLDTALSNRTNAYAVVILLQLTVFALPAILYLRIRKAPKINALRLKLPRPDAIWFLVCMLAVMMCGGLLCGILTGGVSSLAGNFTLYSTFVARGNGSPLDTVLMVLAYCVLPALCEEPIYRGILCAEYEGRGVFVAMTASSLFFAFLHFSFPLFLSYLFLGVCLCAAMYTTRSLLASVILHILYNLFCLFGQPYLSAFYINAGSNEIFIFSLVSLFLLFAAFATGEARKLYHRYAIANLNSAYTSPYPVRSLPIRTLTALFSPACAACLLFWLVWSVCNLLG